MAAALDAVVTHADYLSSVLVRLLTGPLTVCAMGAGFSTVFCLTVKTWYWANETLDVVKLRQKQFADFVRMDFDNSLLRQQARTKDAKISELEEKLAEMTAGL